MKANLQQKCGALVCYQTRYRFYLSWLPQLQMPEKILPSVNRPVQYQFLREGRALPEKLGEGVRCTSLNLNPIKTTIGDFSLPYLWPDQKNSLFQTCLVQTNEKQTVYNAFIRLDIASSKKKHTQFMIKSSRQKAIPYICPKQLTGIRLGASHTYIAHAKEYNPPTPPVVSCV